MGEVIDCVKMFLNMIQSMLIILVSLYSTSVLGNDYERASQLIKDKEYSSAISILQVLANEGDSKSLYKLGYMYHYGFGIEKDDSKAFQYFQSSGDRGFKHARIWQETLMKTSDIFDHLTREEIEESRWKILNKSCFQEDFAVACVKLGDLIRNGRICGKHCKSLGDKNKAARRYYKKADTLGSIDGTYGLAQTESSDKQAIQGYEKVVDWVENGGIIKGHVPTVAYSFDALAGRYYLGKGVLLDKEKAFQYALYAANLTNRRGLITSNTIVGLSLLEKGDNYDPEKSVKYLSWPAARVESSTSIWTIMAASAIYQVYWRGEGVDKSPLKAYKYVTGITNKFNTKYYFDYAVGRDLKTQNIMLAVIKKAIQYQNKICTMLNNSDGQKADCAYASKTELHKYEKNLKILVSRKDSKHHKPGAHQNISPSNKDSNSWDISDVLTAGAAILVGAAILDNLNEDRSSDVKSGGVSGACQNKAIKQIAVCEVQTTDCYSTGCERELVCGKSKDGGSGYACTGFWERVVEGIENTPPFYCDTKNSKNRSESLDEVIEVICENKR